MSVNILSNLEQTFSTSMESKQDNNSELEQLKLENTNLKKLVATLKKKLHDIIGVEMIEKKEECSKKLIYTINWDKKYIDKYNTYIFDCDGVIYRNNKPIFGCDRVINNLTKLNKLVLFVSNSSVKDTKMYIDKLKKCGINDIKDNQIISSGISTALFLKNELIKKENELGFVPKIYLIGEMGFYQTLCNHINTNKYKIIWSQKISNINKWSMDELADYKLDKSVAFVVASFYQQYSYGDISIGIRYLNELSYTQLIGTNEDVTYPAKKGVVLAGSGSLIQSLNVSMTQEKSLILCGKPQKKLFDVICDYHKNIKVDKCLMIGDRLNTDIQFGYNSGMDSALVLTGISQKNDMEKSQVKPNYIMDSINDLL